MNQKFISLYKNLTPILIFFITLNCNKKSEPQVMDLEWREESSKIASNLCIKYKECFLGLPDKIDPRLKTYFETEVSPERCAEKNKKTRVYQLKGNDPDKIKENYRKCGAEVLYSDCSILHAAQPFDSTFCQNVEKIQKGIKL